MIWIVNAWSNYDTEIVLSVWDNREAAEQELSRIKSLPRQRPSKEYEGFEITQYTLNIPFAGTKR